MRGRIGDLDVDFSRQRVDEEVWKSLEQLVEQCGVLQWRDRMLTGIHVNTTEDRAVLHTALRLPRSAKLVVDGVDVVPQVHDVLDRMSILARKVRSGEWVGFTGKRIESVVNIGIGGSDLGPAMAYQALHAYSDPQLSLHFVSNVDPADLVETLTLCEPETTLFIIASKTFTTAETMSNAQHARAWVQAASDGNSDSVVDKHFVALSTNEKAVEEFGIDPKNIF